MLKPRTVLHRMRVYPYVLKQISFAQDFTNLSWEETTFQSNNSHDLTKSVTDFVFSSLPSDDVDMREPHDIFEGVHAHNVTVPSMQEESLFPNHLDCDLTFVVSVPDTMTSSDALIEHPVFGTIGI